MNGEWRVTVDFSTRRKTKIKIAVKKTTAEIRFDLQF